MKRDEGIHSLITVMRDGNHYDYCINISIGIHHSSEHTTRTGRSNNFVQKETQFLCKSIMNTRESLLIAIKSDTDPIL